MFPLIVILVLGILVGLMFLVSRVGGSKSSCSLYSHRYQAQFGSPSIARTPIVLLAVFVTTHVLGSLPPEIECKPEAGYFGSYNSANTIEDGFLSSQGPDEMGAPRIFRLEGDKYRTGVYLNTGKYVRGKWSFAVEEIEHKVKFELEGPVVDVKTLRLIMVHEAGIKLQTYYIRMNDGLYLYAMTDIWGGSVMQQGSCIFKTAE